MVRAELHFRDDTPSIELDNLREVEFNGDKSCWVYLHPTEARFLRIEYEVGRIAFVRLGVS